VRGARVVDGKAEFGASGRDFLDVQRGRIAPDFCRTYARTARSGSDGTLLIPLFWRPGLTMEAQVREGSRVSSTFVLESGAESTVTLREPR
jgi:hypothetical protein